MFSTCQTPSVTQWGTTPDGEISSRSSSRQAAMRIMRPGWPDLQDGTGDRQASTRELERTTLALPSWETLDSPEETVVEAKALPFCCSATTSHEDGEHIALLLVGFCMTSIARRPDASMSSC